MEIIYKSVFVERFAECPLAKVLLSYNYEFVYLVEVKSGAVEPTAVFCCQYEVHKGGGLGRIRQIPAEGLTKLYHNEGVWYGRV